MGARAPSPAFPDIGHADGAQVSNRRICGPQPLAGGGARTPKKQSPGIAGASGSKSHELDASYLVGTALGSGVAVAGEGVVAGAGGVGLMSSNSTSKTSVDAGGIPGRPSSP